MGPAVEPQLREAPVMGEGSWVGLDVHARSVVAGVIDRGSGEVRSRRLAPGGGGGGGGGWGGGGAAAAAGGGRDGRVVEDAAGPGRGCVRGGADWVQACAR